MQEIQNAQDRSVLHGQLYKNLDELIEEGYVKKGKLNGRTNYYTVTDEGYEKLQDRHEWKREHLEARSNGGAE